MTPDTGFFSEANVVACEGAGIAPLFGILKSVMRFRQFLTRGLDNVRNEWTLLCLAWNLKRMAVLRLQ